MNVPNKNTEMFRPYLTRDEMEIVIAAMRQITVKEAVSVRNKFELALFRAERGMSSPAYVATPRETIAQKLGIDVDSDLMARYERGELNGEEEAEVERKLLGL